MELVITQDATNTIDSVKVYSRVNPVAEPLGAHMRAVKLTPSFASTGLHIFDGLPRNPNEFLYGLMFETEDTKFTNIAVVADDVRLVDAPWKYINALARLSTPVKTPQTAKDFQIIDFTMRGLDMDAIPLTMSQLILELTFITTAPNAVPIIAWIGTRAPVAK